MGICPVVCRLGLSPDREITGKPQLGTQMVKSPGLDASRIKTYRAALKGNFTRAYVKESTNLPLQGGAVEDLRYFPQILKFIPLI